MKSAPVLFRMGQWGFRNAFDLLYRLEAVGVEYVPMDGPLLVASNHLSFFDPPAIGSIFPRPTWFFARKTLFGNAFSRYILTSVLSIPVDRDGDSDVGAMRRVLQLMKENQSLVMFPEGTRSPNGHPQDIRTGIGWLACKSQAPILPTRVEGSYDIWNRNMSAPALGPTLRVVFGKPILPAEYDPGSSYGKERFEIAAKRIATLLNAHWSGHSDI
jgi:1-acyl-sn-glycerol-3-phosphate acyltransferase